VLGDERLKLTDELVTTTERQVGLEPLLERGDPPLVQPRAGGDREALRLQVGKSGAAPERERQAQQFRRDLGAARRQRLPPSPTSRSNRSASSWSGSTRSR
jgi:hypothetical protein